MNRAIRQALETESRNIRAGIPGFQLCPVSAGPGASFPG